MNLPPSAQRGQIFLEQGRYQEAEKYFREALAEDPNNAVCYYFLSICLAQQDKDKEALETIDRAISLEPEAPDLHAFRAFVLISLQRSGEAMKSAEEAIRIDPDSDGAWSAKAAVHLSRNEWAHAESAARHALELNPDNNSAANQLAHALRFQNRLQESFDQSDYMLSQNPEDPQTRITVGWTELQRGNHRKAEEHFLEALRLDAGNEHAREGLKEAFRARSPVYRAYLNYSFFLQRFTAGKQWLIILGMLFAVKFARVLLPPPLAILVVFLYFLFVLWVHVARQVGNLQLCFDKLARHALSIPEKVEAWVVGGGVVLGLIMVLSGVMAGWEVVMILGLTLVGASFPFAYTFMNKTAGRYLFGAAGLYVVLVGIAAAFAAGGIIQESPALAGAAAAASLVVIAVTWLANVPALNRRA